VNFTIDQSELVRLSTRAKAIVPTNPSTPILGHVVLTARTPILGQGGGLTATATDNSIAYVGEHAANVTGAGTIAVDAGDLLRTAKVMPAGPVSVTLGDRLKVTLASGRRVFKLDGLDPSAYPGLPEMGAGTTMTMDAGDWRHAIDQVMISIGDDGNKYGLAGIKVDEIGPLARFVTTDGNRLTYSEAPYTGEVWAGRRTILPRRAMAEFRKLLDGVAGPVPATVAERSAVFILPGATLHARMLESEFPDYRQVLPSRFKRKITVNRADLLDGIKAAATFSAADQIRVVFADGTITLSAFKTDAGSAKVEVDAQVDGEALTTGFNPKYLADALGAMIGQVVILDMGDALSPMMLRDPDDDRACFIVMPSRIE
jgi:DNA polymerase-3 subunit beta